MPCWNVITNTVDLEHFDNFNMDVLEAALKARFGADARRTPGRSVFTFRVDGTPVTLAGGRLSSSLPAKRLEELTGQIKQSYGKEAVKYAAKRFGWVAQFNTADPFQFTLTKS